MKPISSLSPLLLGMIGSWLILLFWGSVYLLICGSRDRRRLNPVLRNMLFVFLCILNYALFQCTVAHASKQSETAFVIRIVAWYAKQPAVGLFAFCSLLTAAEAALILFLRHWDSEHITSASVKETIETLPVGICAFEPDGKVTLRNRTMEQLCRSLTGMPLLNGNEFVRRLEETSAELTDFIVSSPEYGVWSFTKDEIRTEQTGFTLLIAYNVTEAYQKTQMLAGRQKTVEELNRKLSAYNRQIELVITQQEILNAKVRIHDELGSGLLAIKHYLVSGGSEKERADLLERLRGNIRFLQQEAESGEQDEYALILSTAEDLGVTVRIDGTLPQTEPNRHVMAAAIHECFTNLIRHTDGDTLTVSITENAHTVTAQFTDNNTLPVGAVTETGGLRSLHDLTARASGEMRITADPRYCLTITLPKETEHYGI